MALKAGRVGVNPNYVDKEGRPLYDNSYLKELLRKEGIITLFTKEGNPISIDNAVEGHLYSCIVTLPLKQAGSGNPAPDNVRNISGYDALKITANSTDTDYTFDNTVFSGVLNVDTGVLTVDTAMGADIVWTKDSRNRFQTISLSALIKKAGSVGSASPNIVSNCYPIVSANDTWNQILGMSLDTQGYIQVYDSTYASATVEEFTAAMSDLQICYKLTAPITVQLTPAQIALVTGSNTVSSTIGTIMDLQYLGTLVPGGANGRSLNRSLNLNREVIDGEERKEIQEEIKEVPVEEPVTVKKSTKKSTK